MTAFTDLITRAGTKTACDVMQALGGAATNVGVYSLAGGAGGPKAGAVALGIGAASFFAANLANCSDWDPSSGTDLPQDGFITPGSCLETAGCNLQVNDAANVVYLGRIKKLVSVVGTDPYPNGTPAVMTTYVNCDGETVQDKESRTRAPFTTTLLDGAQCGNEVALPEYDIPDYPYTDPDTGCQLIVKTLGWAGLPGDIAAPVFKIEPAPDQLRESDGGRIGGCNFAPVIHYNPPGGPGGPGGPPYTGPYDGPDDDIDPDTDVPFWLDALQDLVTGVLSEEIGDLIDELQTDPVPEGQYTLTSVCEVDANGDPEQKIATVVLPEAKGEAALISRLDAIAALLQPLKDFKQPICDAKIELEGDFRTITFVSDTRTDAGDRYLSKRFRYRSQSGIGLNGLVDHWKDFEWDAGPVCVIHSGSNWGTPQVWASSADEGKRVILHAAREAGIDPNQVGKWTVSGSDNPRFGVSGRMKVITKGGYYWITARLGSDARPIVATT